MNKDSLLIVGAGFGGATLARIFAENDYKVKVIDKRDHIGGNSYDYLNENNERIHKYGPHLLHGDANSKAIKFLSRFTKWTKYEHKVRALLSDMSTTSLPINRNTLEHIFKIKLNDKIDTRNFLDSIRDKNIIAKNSDELFLSSVGEKLADIFFRPYTKKMWGIDPKELDVQIGARLPVRTNRDERYFTDNFQFLPKNGYNSLFERMLDHKNIQVNLNTEFTKSMEKHYLHNFLCLPIDQYFNYCFGKLPYRSLLFENKILKNKNLSAPQVNFTDNSSYTRMTQWDLLPNCPSKNATQHTLTYEIPVDINENPGEYYYPVQTQKSRMIFAQYEDLSNQFDNITFCGRTGLFKYIDMVPAVSIHIQKAYNFLKKVK